MRTRKLPEERKKQLLEIAIEIAKEAGYSHLTRNGVALQAQVSYGLVTAYFKSIHHLKKLVVKEAISRGIVEIVAQAMVRKDPLTQCLDEKLKEKVFRYLSK